MQKIFFWIFVGFLLFGCFMYFQIRKDALWLVGGLGISICLVLVVIVAFDKLLVSYIKEKCSRVNSFSSKLKAWKKPLRFFRFAFCMQAYADTYYCTQTAKVLIEPNNKVKKYYKFDDIYKLTIHKKENTLSLHP